MSLQNKFLQRSHNMRLVVSSWSYQVLPIDRTFEEALDVADGMAAAPGDVYKIHNSGKGPEESSTSSTAGPRSAGPQSDAALSPQTRVTNKLIEAYSAASGAAAAAASPLASAAGNIYAGLASLPIPSLGGSNGGGGRGGLGAESGNSGVSKPPIAASLGKAVVLTAQALAVGQSSLGNESRDKGPTTSVAATWGESEASFSSPSAAVSSICPSEWYVADDDVRHLRVFVIQGSESIDHWRLNLTFDPVVFEDPALGVTVSAGGMSRGCSTGYLITPSSEMVRMVHD
jgi:hypothetical protein